MVIQLISVTQFFIVLKSCNKNVCVHCMRDVFSNKQSKKAMMQFQIALGMIPKIKGTLM